MAYIIYKNGNNILTVLDVGEVDSSTTSLDLIGKNVNNYGEFFNNNFVKLLTNFADDTQPNSPQEGQLWFDTSAGRLKIYDGSNWDSTLGSYVDNNEPANIGTGEFWFNDTTKQVYAYDGNQFWLVGPHTPPQDGLIGFYTATFKIFDYVVPVDQYYPSVLYSRGEYVGMISDDNFTLDPSSGTVFYSVNTSMNIVKGMSLFNDLNVRGDIYQNGSNIFYRPRQETAYYDITRFGKITNSAANSLTNKINYDNANVIIAQVITKVFPPSSTEYPIDSSCKVICDFKEVQVISTTTAFSATGTNTITINSITGIQPGYIVEGSFGLYPQTLVAEVGGSVVTLTNALVSFVTTDTNITLSTVTSTVRHFTVINSPPIRWVPYEVYTATTVGVNLGNFTMTNIVV